MKIGKKPLLAACLLLSAPLLTNCGGKGTDSKVPIRLGWQVAQTNQGQLIQALKHTTILDYYDLQVEFRGFPSADKLTAAALAGETDVILMAALPAALLLARSPDWTIVSRLANNRVALYVPPDSPLESAADLKGKTIALPLGSAAHQQVIKLLREAGIDADKEVHIIDLEVEGQDSVIKRGSRADWGKVEALAAQDPAAAIREANGSVRILQTGKIITLLAVANDFLNAHPETITDLLQAFMDAYLYFARHPDNTGRWFLEESQQVLSPKVLKICASLEPNYRAWMKGHVSLNLPEPDIKALQEAADFSYQQGQLNRQVDLRAKVDLSYLRRAEQKWWASREIRPEIRESSGR